MLILGIESSCDETGLALYDTKAGLIGNTLFSQVDLHQAYGGVVPELASRDHIKRCTPLLQQLLRESNKELADLDGIAYTAGPGLAGCLLVGSCFAKSLAFGLNIPSYGVHHMEGHVLAALIGQEDLAFPFLTLLVSGGHTMLAVAEDYGRYQVLGESMDDAVGEVFDKVAKVLGLPYPGGPHLAKLAEQGVLGRFTFTKPMIGKGGLNFSFSGLKTQVIQCIRQTNPLDQQIKADIAVAFQDVVVATLLSKCQDALEQTGLKTLIAAGGVSANRHLRAQFQHTFASQGVQVLYPKLSLCTDNGAMIAYAGAIYLSQGLQDEDLSVTIRPRWPL